MIALNAWLAVASLASDRDDVTRAPDIVLIGL
jgi:hypothetical protein